MSRRRRREDTPPTDEFSNTASNPVPPSKRANTSRSHPTTPAAATEVDEYKFRCPMACGKSYSRPHDLKAHIVDLHHVYPPNGTSYQCDACLNYFSSKKRLDKHYSDANCDETQQRQRTQSDPTLDPAWWMFEATNSKGEVKQNHPPPSPDPTPSKPATNAKDPQTPQDDPPSAKLPSSAQAASMLTPAANESTSPAPLPSINRTGYPKSSFTKDPQSEQRMAIKHQKFMGQTQNIMNQAGYGRQAYNHALNGVQNHSAASNYGSMPPMNYGYSARISSQGYNPSAMQGRHSLAAISSAASAQLYAPAVAMNRTTTQNHYPASASMTLNQSFNPPTAPTGALQSSQSMPYTASANEMRQSQQLLPQTGFLVEPNEHTIYRSSTNPSFPLRDTAADVYDYGSFNYDGTSRSASVPRTQRRPAYTRNTGMHPFPNFDFQHSNPMGYDLNTMQSSYTGSNNWQSNANLNNFLTNSSARDLISRGGLQEGNFQVTSGSDSVPAYNQVAGGTSGTLQQHQPIDLLAGTGPLQSSTMESARPTVADDTNNLNANGTNDDGVATTSMSVASLLRADDVGTGKTLDEHNSGHEASDGGESEYEP
ncbi:MAG: hypothetical protein M1820_002327 [Bogoriella megaspora]|nr:MAG: hypothetical protein M1820_002327 [Bogoriella megaspora]